MSAIQKLLLCLFLSLFILGLTGCKTEPEVQILSGGYEEITHPNKFPDDSQPPRVSLDYRDPNGQTLLIWPSLFSSDEIINDGVVLFVGDEAYVSSDPDDSRGTRPRVFVVKAPGPPLDITEQVLWYWSKEAGRDFGKATRLFNFAALVKRGDKVEVQLEFYVNESGWPDNATLLLDWNQIAEIMRTMQMKGALRKDPRWGTPYLAN